MRNSEVADQLDRIADLLELKGSDRYRVYAYQEAARAIRSLGRDIETIRQEGRLEEIQGVGPSIAAKIAEFLKTNHCAYLEQLEREVPVEAATLMQVPGLGPKRARLLAEKLKIKSVSELIRAAEDHRIQALPGMGEKSEQQLLKEARRYAARSSRIPLYLAWPQAEELATLLRDHPAVERIEPAGSIRRRKETIGDIDLLVASRDAQAVFDRMVRLPVVQEVILRGPTKCTILTRSQFQVDVRVIAPEEWGSALLYFTGSKAHNIRLRSLALAKGYTLSEYGIFRLDTGKRVASRTEAEIYETLGLTWIPPEIREDGGELEAAAGGTLPELVELEDLRGDFHTHTTYSDGRDSVETMARAAIARGYDWLVVSDHSFGLPVVGGLTKEKALQQRREIAILNRELAPFRILHGVELEIRGDGTLDFDDAFLAGFDVVGASLHSGTRRDGERNTRRILQALEDPEVDGLNHPTGRITGKRDAYDLDVDRVIEAARRLGKTLEIDGNERLDLPSELVRRARDRGSSFTLSSDAHGADQLSLIRYALAIARRGWLEKRHVLNVLDAQALTARRHPRKHGRP